MKNKYILNTQKYKVETPFGNYSLFISKYVSQIYVGTIIYNTFNSEKNVMVNEPVFNIGLENFASLNETDLWDQINDWLKDLTNDKYFIESY